MKKSLPISFANSGYGIAVGVEAKRAYFVEDLKKLLDIYNVNLETSWTAADDGLYLANRDAKTDPVRITQADLT